MKWNVVVYDQTTHSWWEEKKRKRKFFGTELTDDSRPVFKGDVIRSAVMLSYQRKNKLESWEYHNTVHPGHRHSIYIIPIEVALQLNAVAVILNTKYFAHAHTGLLTTLTCTLRGLDASSSTYDHFRSTDWRPFISFSATHVACVRRNKGCTQVSGRIDSLALFQTNILLGHLVKTPVIHASLLFPSSLNLVQLFRITRKNYAQRKTNF